MPYIVLSYQYRLSLLNYLNTDPEIAVGFRSWDLYEYPILPQSSKHIWTVKTSSQLEKPRFVILGFQTNRNNQAKANASHFYHCKLRNVKLYLNSQSYPYGNLNLDFGTNTYSLAYEMFKNFQTNYYGKDVSETIIRKKDFKEFAPLTVIDCSKQYESLKYAPVDIRIEFESKDSFPAQTSAFCLILHDSIIHYKPISGEVKKL